MSTTRLGLAIDVLLVLAAAGIALANLTADVQGTSEREPDALGVALALGMVLPILLRRRRPLAALVIACAAWLLLAALDYPAMLPLAPLIAIYTIGEARSRDTRRIGAVVALATLLAFSGIAIGAGRPAGVEPEWVLGLAALGVSAWLVGDRLRARSDAVVAQRRIAVAEDRARVARELHDSVGHAINAIAINAGAARLNLDGDRELAREALDRVELSARRTAAEMDAVLGDLRGAGGLPSAAQLHDLIANQRALGQRVTASIDCEGVEGVTGRALYRIVQEALTNASRHAPGEDVALHVARDGKQLRIEISNASMSGPPSEGRGLRGIRERVAALGGTVSVDAQDGRFVLAASLPLKESG